MKILWHANAPWAATGYGQQTGIFAPMFKEAGHDIALSAFYGLHGGLQEWGDIKVYPAGADIWGNDVLASHAYHHMQGARDGWIMTLLDVWVLNSPSLHAFNVASWVPVDHTPAPPAVVEYFCTQKAVPIAMSHFGVEELTKAGLEPLYVPHGIDTRHFVPVDKAEAREAIGLPQDAYVVGMNAANKGQHVIRKAFPQVFRAFAEWNNPDAVLFVHSEQWGTMQGTNLDNLAEGCGIKPHQIVFSDQYTYRLGLPVSSMKWLYGAMDVLANPSYGEGFGIPIVEAQACGVPVIGNDCTSMPELIAYGTLVGGEPWWDSYQKAWWQIPYIGALVDAFREMRATPPAPEVGVEFAANYDARRIMTDYWTPVLADLEARSDNPEAVPLIDAASLLKAVE